MKTFTMTIDIDENILWEMANDYYENRQKEATAFSISTLLEESEELQGLHFNIFTEVMRIAREM